MIRKVIGIYYSPAGGTKIMTEALARKIGAVLDDCSPLDVSVECYDMLREESNSITFNDETVAVVGMPVYVGKIPLPAAAAMRKIAGNGAMTLAIVSYGGRKYGNALFELKRLVEECGFKAIGAGAFMISYMARRGSATSAVPAIDREALLEFSKASTEKIKRLAVGPSDKDYAWTETLLKKCFERAGSWNNAHGFMDGLTLHYYTLPYDWAKKGAATGFNEKEWYMTLRKTLFMEEYIAGHSAIMDRYDPEKQIGLMVDEWGTWYDVEEGTNPGFLYQQNTIRDALVAGINLNIFNKHADRVKMANIAQLVNVLQAVILTEGEKMIKTPTYYVFKMYSAHQDNDLLESSIDTKKVGLEDEYMVPNLTESVSVDRSGKIIITVTNLSLDEEAMIESVLLGANIKDVKAKIVKGKMDDHNTFDAPDVVKEEEFKNISFKNDKIRYTIPPSSVMCIEVTA